MADIRKLQDGDRATIFVGGELTIASAGALKAAIAEALHAAASVDIVVENTTAIDVSFPQLLCSAHRTAAAWTKTLSVFGMAQEQVASMLLRSGFSRQTGCQENTRTTCLWLCAKPADA